MKKFNVIRSLCLLLMPLTVLFSFCKKDTPKKEDPAPAACFKMKRIIGVKEVITFQNCSENFDRVEWNFGDGTSSTISEPSKSWEKKDIFLVTLTVYKGTASSKYSALVYVGQKSSISLNAAIKWDNPSKYYVLYMWAYLHRSNDLQNVYSYYASTGYFDMAFGDSVQSKNFPVKRP